MNYTVIKSDTEEIDWSAVPKLQISNYQTQPLLPVKATGQMCWGEEDFFVRLEATEGNILARFTGEYDQVCRDSCLECFLSPDLKDGRYFNIEMNPNGATYLGIGTSIKDLRRLHPDNIRQLFSIRTCRDGDTWSVDYRIPFSFIREYMPGFLAEKGHPMRANFYKCGDDIEPVHELSWSPITNGNSDFHQPEFFGDLVLG